MIELLFSGNLTDKEELATHLSLMGLSPQASENWAGRFARTASTLSVTRPNDGGFAPLAFFVPGRLEVLGKHTDYAGGRSLFAATERGFCVVAAPRNDRQIVLIDASSGETFVFRGEPEMEPLRGSWAYCPMKLVRRLARNFPGAIQGADIAFFGDVPRDAGLCRSRALLTGVFFALAEANRLSSRDEYWHNIGGKTDLASYLGAIESGQTFGTLAGEGNTATPCCGGQDYTAILCAEPDHLSQYAYCPTEFEKTIAVPARYCFAIGVSGRPARNVDSATEPGHKRVEQALQLVELWRDATGRDDQHLAEALGSSPEADERLKGIVDASGLEFEVKHGLLGRLEHFVAESSLIPEAADALAAGDWKAFGQLVDRSQAAFEQLLGDQMPAETSFLAATARRLGAVAASTFGFGGGGSVWALIRKTKQSEFLAAWSHDYREAFPEFGERSAFFTSPAGPGAFRVC